MVMAQRSSFAVLLKQYRAAAGLTQEQLAERAGLSVRGISDLERGVNRRPQPDTLAQLIAALRLGAVEQTTLEAAAGRGFETHVEDAIAVNARLPVIGRSSELATLSRHLEDGKPRILVLAGEPGIGKTRLLQEASIQAREKGFTVLSGGSRRLHGEIPY